MSLRRDAESLACSPFERHQGILAHVAECDLFESCSRLLGLVGAVVQLQRMYKDVVEC